MIRFGKGLKVEEAEEIGVVQGIVENYYDMIKLAIEEVDRLRGNVPHIPDGEVHIEEIELTKTPMSGSLLLSPQAVGIVDKTIRSAAKATTFHDALEIGYRGFAETACTDAAKEGIFAFQERRKPKFVV